MTNDEMIRILKSYGVVKKVDEDSYSLYGVLDKTTLSNPCRYVGSVDELMRLLQAWMVYYVDEIEGGR